MRCKQFYGELFAKTQLYFRRFHGFLDRLPRFPLLTQLSFAGQSLLLIALLSELLWDRIADKSHDPAEKSKGKHRQSRHDRQEEHEQSCDRQSARISDKLIENRLLRRSSCATLRHKQRRRQRDY